MQNQMIRLAVHTQTVAITVAERLSEMQEGAKEERGQAAAEYLGIILLVSVIIAVLVASDIGTQIKDGISNLVDNIGNGEDGRTN